MENDSIESILMGYYRICKNYDLLSHQELLAKCFSNFIRDLSFDDVEKLSFNFINTWFKFEYKIP